MKQFDMEMTLALIEWIQLKNHRAYLSHRKRKLEELNEIAL